MPRTTDRPSDFTQLRDKAAAQLKAGTAPAAGHWSIGIDALRLLHRLSCDPQKAEDALKLLHELQVHQVELDLQNEEIAANEQQLVEDLQFYRALYEGAPVAYCVVDLSSTVILSNLAADELFGCGQVDLEGTRIDTLLNPQDRSLLLALLERVASSGGSEVCVAGTGAALGERQLQFQASASAQQEQLLLICSKWGVSGKHE